MLVGRKKIEGQIFANVRGDTDSIEIKNYQDKSDEQCD